MVDNPTNIELIPWYHDYRTIYHKKLVEHIKNKIPKNSYLALEISHGNYKFSYGIMKELMQGKIPKLFDETDYSHMSLVDILNECVKKNIKIIPIDSFVLDMPLLGKYKILQNFYLSNFYGFNKIRNNTMYRTILRTILHNPKIKNLPIIVGPAHIPFLKNKLDDLKLSKKINVKVILDIFGENYLEPMMVQLTHLQEIEDQMDKNKNKKAELKKLEAEHKKIFGSFLQFYNLMQKNKFELPEVNNKKITYKDIFLKSLRIKYLKDLVRIRSNTKRLKKKNIKQFKKQVVRNNREI